MKNMHRPWIAGLLSFSTALVVGMLGWGSGHARDVRPRATVPAGPVPVNAAPVVGSVVAATVSGAVSSSGGPAEAVVFSGQASISGKVIHDPDFGTPPVIEIIVDLSKVSGVGLRSRKAYLVSTQAVLHRPLLAFDSVEVSFPFVAEGEDMLRARSGLASFGIQFSAAGGITASRVIITDNRPH